LTTGSDQGKRRPNNKYPTLAGTKSDKTDRPAGLVETLE
jgi:hypothetical protein